MARAGKKDFPNREKLRMYPEMMQRHNGRRRDGDGKKCGSCRFIFRPRHAAMGT